MLSRISDYLLITALQLYLRLLFATFSKLLLPVIFPTSGVLIFFLVCLTQ